jgi:FMN-dependent NADH-azoreductase
MPNLLLLDSSADLVHSRTRALTEAFSDAWQARGDEYTITVRDLHRNPVPHLTDAALHWPPRLRPADAAPPADDEALQAELIAELVAADVLVIGAPMYNYAMPSTLKAWIDHIHVPGVTAPLDEPTQPMAGRPAVVVTARGATYDAGSPSEGWDHVLPPLELILGGALGMDVTTVITSRTLADTLPALAPQLDAAILEFAAAYRRMEELGASL